MTRAALMLALAMLALAMLAGCTLGEETRGDAGTGAWDSDIPRDAQVPPTDAQSLPTDAQSPPGDAMNGYVTDDPDGGCGSSTICTPIANGCGGADVCGDGIDQDCDREVDEGCPCVPGTVQNCFLGPPGSRGVGACRSGSQRCEGTFEFGTWGACTSSVSPSIETCNGVDDDCDGCQDDGCCNNPGLSCPQPGDPRIADGTPFVPYMLLGTDFFEGSVASWRWTVQGGPCDSILSQPTFSVSGEDSEQLVFTPTLSGDYTITLGITTTEGIELGCTFVVHIAGVGVRVELCWRNEGDEVPNDLDLYLHDPRHRDPWFSSNIDPYRSTNGASCNWSNCAATVRSVIGGTSSEIDWGLAASRLTACEHGPQGTEWRARGSCRNPRIDIDGHGIDRDFVENVNVDNPRDGEPMRVMVHHYGMGPATPIVNVYCGGHLRASVGTPPDSVPNFMRMDEPPEYVSYDRPTVGLMWRVADIVPQVNAAGVTQDCEVVPLRDSATGAGFNVTWGDRSY